MKSEFAWPWRAQPSHVRHLVLGQGLRCALWGVGIGLWAALALTRLMASLLYGVTAADPLSFIVVGILLALTATSASYVPARRSMRVDPMVALRYKTSTEKAGVNASF